MEKIISLTDIWIQFSDTPILQGLNLDVIKGESLVIVGSSGCGKTVLLKTILGLIPITKGHISLFGEQVNGTSKNKIMELRSRVGMVFQSSALFDSLTVWENVGFYYLNHTDMTEQQIRSAVREILAEMGMENFENLFRVVLSFFGEHFAFVVATMNFRAMCENMKFEIEKNHAHLLNTFKETFNEINKMQVKIIENARLKNEIKIDLDDETVSVYVTSLIRGIIFEWKIRGTMGDIEEEINHLQMFLKSGLMCNK